jgi:PadR family transcriptional regulator AphA
VEHVRDVRSHLLLKLALLDRVGGDAAELIRRQRAVLEPIVVAIMAEEPQDPGFDAPLIAWRQATAAATLSFLDNLTVAGSKKAHGAG